MGQGGDPPGDRAEEDSRRPAGVTEGGGAVASPRKKKTTPFFHFSFIFILIGLTSGPLSMLAHTEFSLPA
jgi:hypothetical protein